MRAFIFAAGLLTLAVGPIAMGQLPKNEAFPMLQGALTLGGGWIICGLFSLRNPAHGTIGAGVLGLLGAGRGLMNLPRTLERFSGPDPRPVASVMETMVTGLCITIILLVLANLQRERARRQLAGN